MEDFLQLMASSKSKGNSSGFNTFNASSQLGLLRSRDEILEIFHIYLSLVHSSNSNVSSENITIPWNSSSGIYHSHAWSTIFSKGSSFIREAKDCRLSTKKGKTQFMMKIAQSSFSFEVRVVI
jgi:hypothetical protein